MGVYIKGMEMPESCASCRFYGVSYCYAKGDEDAHSTAPCPLVELPPHGRLIDADALKEKMKIVTRTAVQEIVEYDINAYKVDDAPTIIPAEEGEI